MTSIRKTLAWQLAGGALVLLLAAAATGYAGARHLFVEQFDDVLRTKLATFATLIEQEDEYIELEFIDLAMPEFSAETEPEYVQLWLADRTDDWVLYRSPSLGEADLARLGGTEEAPALRDLELPDGRAGRAIGAEFVVRHHEPGPSGRGPVRLALVIAKGTARLDQALATLILGAGGLIALVLGLGFLVGGAALRRGLRPLDDLTDEVGSISDPLKAPRFDPAGMPAELLPLAESHNLMLDRIRAAFERERRTAANIAHELRTPVSELVVLAETLQYYPVGSAESDRRLEELRDISFQMSSLIATLLELARMESGHAPLEIEPVDLPELVRECWDPLRGTADAKHQTFEGLPAEGPTVSTDRVAISILFANLLRNAVDHAPEGDRIRCGIENGGDRAWFVLANAANGLSPDDAGHLTDPFWRASPAREDRDHAGIGLSLVRRFAELLELGLDFRIEAGVFEARLGFPVESAGAVR